MTIPESLHVDVPDITVTVALRVCYMNLHCKPSQIIRIPEGHTKYLLQKPTGTASAFTYPYVTYTEEVVTIMEWRLRDGGTIHIGMSDDFDTVVIAGKYHEGQYEPY